MKCGSDKSEASLGDASSLPLIPKPRLSPQEIKPLSPLSSAFLPQTSFTVVQIHTGCSPLRQHAPLGFRSSYVRCLDAPLAQ